MQSEILIIWLGTDIHNILLPRKYLPIRYIMFDCVYHTSVSLFSHSTGSLGSEWFVWAPILESEGEGNWKVRWNALLVINEQPICRIMTSCSLQ